MNDENAIYELSELDISTVGLVSRGANGESFFLLKSLEGGDVENTPEVSAAHVPQVEASFWQKLVGVFRKVAREEIVKYRADDEDEAEAEDNPEEEADEQPDDPTETEDESEESDETEKTAAEATVESGSSASNGEATTPEVGSSPMEKNHMDEIEKAALEAKLAEIEKVNADLVGRVEKAEAEALFEKEARERQVYLQKAQEMPCLPVPATEVADHMYWLRKSDAKRADWFENVMKAVNSQLRTSELFANMGTSRTPTEASLLEKAETISKTSGVSLRDAILKMSPEEQMAYIAERQRETR